MYQKNHSVLIGGYLGSSMIMAQNFHFIVLDSYIDGQDIAS